MDRFDRHCPIGSAYFARVFVCTALATLLGLHIYGYISSHGGEVLDEDFSDIKYVVTQLTRGLTEVNRKHEALKGEMERIVTAIPRVQSGAGRGRDALQAGCGRKVALDVDYDRQVTDFALESAGARVLDVGDTVPHVNYESTVGYALHTLVSFMCRGSHECLNARAMLRPGTLPGECWAFKGQRGQATIRLLGTIHVSGVSLEHIPAHISPTKEISSAPRLFQLEGLQSRNDDQPHDFGTFEYSREGRPIQYFEVQNPSPKPFNIVRVKIISNWGHPVYTCVYRIRVHGELAQGKPKLASPHISEEDNIVDIE